MSSQLSYLSQRDLALLQGVWEQTRLEADGVVNPDDDHGAIGALTTIAGNTFSVQTIMLKGAFVLDASTMPKSIVWIDSIGADKNKLLPAIYTLEDCSGQLTPDTGLSFSSATAGARPPLN
jgi:uncharacterized protein (TIGR03067 family)